MRFMSDGPDIPHDLLIARDQGRVVFICGAGVSLARSKLPDFWGLAEEVAKSLGILPFETISQIIQTARSSPTGHLKTISADRLFGLIEQDFEISDIYEAVSAALKPKLDTDLSAHKILLDLATTREGHVRLITTNFDLLFNECNRSLPSHKPPRLPNPKRPKELHGIVYLHGCVNVEYSNAQADGFVLSSSEFGQAYLSDGWATSFIKEILNNYIVVFVGYSADDPPMQYLLEALRKAQASRKDIYAFHPVSNVDGYSHWKQKGVIPIVYNDVDKHRALWETLEAWASRARNPTEWYAKLLEESMKGPSHLHPHVRGQVAHMVSTYEGMKRFSSNNRIPPGDWLLVFDKNLRCEIASEYAGENGSMRSLKRERYLDSDINRNEDLTDSSDVWSAFTPNDNDRLSITAGYLSTVSEERSSYNAELLPRLRQLAWWISRVADQIVTIQWAANQKWLHPDFCRFMASNMQDNQKKHPAVVRRAWHYILESKPISKDPLHIYELMRIIEIDGWSDRVVRHFANYFRPNILVEKSYTGKLTLADDINSIQLNNLIRLEVKYEMMNRPEIGIPNEWKKKVVVVLRENLQLALKLENELNDSYSYSLRNLGPLHTNPDARGHSSGDELSSYLVYFSVLFKELVEIDTNAALAEIQMWPTDDDTIFARLRIWVADEKKLVSPSELVETYLSLSDNAFWQDQHQRDFLITLANRWGELNKEERELIEERIIKGPENWGVEESKFEQVKAYYILERIHWLNDNNCDLNCDVEQLTKVLQKIIPAWTNDDAKNAAQSNEARAGWVNKTKDHSSLQNIRIDEAIDLIKKSGRRTGPFSENDSFLGLVEDRPVFAFRVLSFNAKQKIIHSELWDTFLSFDNRKNDSPRFVRLIAGRILSYAPIELKTILHPVCNWISELSEAQHQAATKSIANVISKILEAIRQYPSDAGSTISRPDKTHDWVMDSINSPVGKIVKGMFLEPGIPGEIDEIPESWLKRIDLILSLPAELRRHASVFLHRNLNWFFHFNESWTEINLMPDLTSSDPLTRNAAWAGLFWSSQLNNGALFRRLKSIILDYTDNHHNLALSLRFAEVVVSGWSSIDPTADQRYLSDEELQWTLIRHDEQFREQILSIAWRRSSDIESKERWRPLLIELLRMWPRRRSLKSANTTSLLLNIAFSGAEDFPTLVKLIVPLITKADQRAIHLYNLTKDDNQIINDYPSAVLDLLYVVVPSDVNRWPYEMGVILNQLESVNASLRNDERMIRLNQLWDSR